MFTGLISALGRVTRLERSAEGARIEIEADTAAELGSGDSIAVNGVCLTATEVDGRLFAAEVVNETLARSALGGTQPGDEVNLELPLRASDRLGGHVVQGHVDG
ncbi:MAG TPA: riboflavin synthase, partial [Solirubrobacteraceae bacterium]